MIMISKAVLAWQGRDNNDSHIQCLTDHRSLLFIIVNIRFALTCSSWYRIVIHPPQYNFSGWRWEFSVDTANKERTSFNWIHNVVRAGTGPYCEEIFQFNELLMVFASTSLIAIFTSWSRIYFYRTWQSENRREKLVWRYRDPNADVSQVYL